MGRARRKAVDPSRRMAITASRPALSSLDIVRAAALARERALSSGHATHTSHPDSKLKQRFWLRVPPDKRSENSEDESLLLGAYILSAWYQNVTIAVHVRSRLKAASISEGLKKLNVATTMIHASSSKQQAGCRVITICDNALAVKQKQIERAKVKVAAHGDKVSHEMRAKRERGCGIAVDLTARSEAAAMHPASSDAQLVALARVRCRLASALLKAVDAREYMAQKLRLEVALRAPSVSKIKPTRCKMVLLGMMTVELPSGFVFQKHASLIEGRQYRQLARTRYLDGRLPDATYLSEAWLGNQRTGASADHVSRRVAKCVRETKVAVGWSPNPTANKADWGGAFGKACAHNEVCLHCVRPFAPLEVLNTRICSRHHPAPGNEGYDGCLEFLANQCRRKHRPHTVWDNESFVWISPAGNVRCLPKASFLKWPLPRIHFVISVLREFTISSQGRASPHSLLTLIDALLKIALDHPVSLVLVSNGRQLALPKVPTCLVVAFALGGTPKEWRAARYGFDDS